MDDRAALATAWSHLPEYLGQHVLLSAGALLLGVALSAPLVLLATKRHYLRDALLVASGAAQIVPSLALIALFYPSLLALSSLAKHMLGHGFSALGFVPSLLALTLYCTLPIIRNTLVGLGGVDPRAVEAARGVGMTDRQLLFRVELPLAMPMILTGIRTSGAWVVGAAMLSTPLGQASLGNYIFDGLRTENWVYVLFGCVAAALLALSCDQLLRLVERGVELRDRRRIALGRVGLVLGCVLATVPLVAHQPPQPQADQFLISGDLVPNEIRSSALTDATSTVAMVSSSEGRLQVRIEKSGNAAFRG